eukprot:276373-Rhodomonas_salina.1
MLCTERALEAKRRRGCREQLLFEESQQLYFPDIPLRHNGGQVVLSTGTQHCIDIANCNADHSTTLATTEHSRTA